MMKIGYLVQQFPPEIGAGPARVGELGLRWQESGAKLQVATAVPNRPAGVIPPEYRGKWFVREEWNGITALRSWLYASPKHGFARTVVNNLTFMATGTASACFRMERPDVLIASSPPFFVHLGGLVAARRWRVPLVLEVRDLWPDYLAGMGKLRNPLVRKALFALESYLLRSADAVVVVTETFRKRVIEKGVQPDRVHVIPNGVDLDQYYHDPHAEPPVRPWPEDRFVAGYLGNFGASQRLETLVETARILAKDAPGVALLLVGDGTERARVEHVVRLAGLKNITIHPPIAKAETRAFYNSCDACIVPLADIPALQDTIPSKIFEIMACERPVIGSVAGEAAAIIDESGSGVVSRPGNPRELADAVRAVSRLPVEERKRMGATGRRFVAGSYERGALAERYLSILKTVSGESRRPGEVQHA